MHNFHSFVGQDGIAARVFEQSEIAARVCVIGVSPVTKRFVVDTFFVQRGINVLSLRDINNCRSLTCHGQQDTFIILNLVSSCLGCDAHPQPTFDMSQLNLEVCAKLTDCQLMSNVGSLDLLKLRTLMIVRLTQLVSTFIRENIIPI